MTMDEFEIVEIESTKKKLPKKEKKERGLYDTKKEPRKALSNYMRNQYRMLFSVMAMADRKAMIMVRINATIVSVLIVFHRFLITDIKFGVTMGVILLIGGTLSLILSLLAASPIAHLMKSIWHKEIHPKYPELKYNNFMIFNYHSLEEYEESMNEVINSQELQIGNQVRTSYLINLYNSHKYKLLYLSYSIFLVSFVAVILIFITGLLFY